MGAKVWDFTTRVLEPWGEAAAEQQELDWQQMFRLAVCDRPCFFFSLDRRSVLLRFQTDQTIFVSLWPLVDYSLPIHQPHVSVGLRTEICKLLRMMLLAWPGPSGCAVSWCTIV